MIAAPSDDGVNIWSYKCSSTCSTDTSWTLTAHEVPQSVTDNFDAAIDSENTIHIVGIFDDGDGDLNNDSLTYYHLLSDGTSTNFSLNSSAYGNDENSSIAISISPDDSVHIVHETYDLGLIYSSCSGDCDSINNWQNETLPYDTGIFDLAIDSDHEPYLAFNNSGLLLLANFLTKFGTSASKTTCIPPCRSRPKLIEFFDNSLNSNGLLFLDFSFCSGDKE